VAGPDTRQPLEVPVGVRGEQLSVLGLGEGRCYLGQGLKAEVLADSQAVAMPRDRTVPAAQHEDALITAAPSQLPARQ
jgi:hypothetical protein